MFKVFHIQLFQLEEENYTRILLDIFNLFLTRKILYE